MPPEYADNTDPQVTERRARDDHLLTELTAPPSVEEAREAYDFWRNRRAALPVYDRAGRKEADQMASRWKERLASTAAGTAADESAAHRGRSLTAQMHHMRMLDLAGGVYAFYDGRIESARFVDLGWGGS